MFLRCFVVFGGQVSQRFVLKREKGILSSLSHLFPILVNNALVQRVIVFLEAVGVIIVHINDLLAITHDIFVVYFQTAPPAFLSS